MKKIFLLIMGLFFLYNPIKSQHKQINKYEFIYNNNILFVDSVVIVRKNLIRDTTIIKQVFQVKLDSFKIGEHIYYIYLSKNNSLYFLDYDKSEYTIIYKVLERIKDDYGNKFFPSNYFLNDIDNDGIKEIIVKLIEFEGPVFKVLVLKWGKNYSNISEILSLKNLFKYPSWNPFAVSNDISLQGNKVIIPYCEGCQSGKSGVEKKAIVEMDSKTQKIVVNY